jgi:hypothetical protein
MMSSLEPITVTLLIALLSGKVLMSAYYANGPNKRHMRILNILIAPLLIAFCVIVVKSVVPTASILRILIAPLLIAFCVLVFKSVVSAVVARPQPNQDRRQ